MNSFQFLGFASFLITASDGTTILIDPYIDDNPLSPLKTADLPKIDLILVSHAAFDHMKDTSKVWKRDKSRIICGGETMAKLIEEGVDASYITTCVWGLQVEQCGIKVRPTVSMHRSSVKLANGSTADGFALGMVVMLPDGTRVYNAGDTALFSDMKLIGEFMKPDIGLMNVTIENCFDFLPEFQTGEMTAYEAAVASEWLGLKYAVGCHFADRKGEMVSRDLKEFREALEKRREEIGDRAPVPVILDPGEVFEYSAEND